MTNLSRLTLLLLAAWALPAPGQVADPAVAPVSESELEAALALYAKEPLTPKGADAAVTVMNYAAQDPKLNVVFFEDAVPWIINDAAGNPTSELMAAFVVGNVKAQRASGQAGTDSYAGCLEVLRVYDLIRAERPELRMADLERFRKMEEAGTLKPFLAEVDARNKERMAQETERSETLPPGQLDRLLEGM